MRSRFPNYKMSIRKEIGGTGKESLNIRLNTLMIFTITRLQRVGSVKS